MTPPHFKPAFLAVAIPGCVVAAACMATLVLAPFERSLFWPVVSLNISEAAAMRDVAEVVRRVERGENVNESHPIRPEVIAGPAVVLTPVEAAVEAGDEHMLQVLFTEGATLDERAWTNLRCGTDRDGIRAVLDAHRPSAKWECQPAAKR